MCPEAEINNCKKTIYQSRPGLKINCRILLANAWGAAWGSETNFFVAIMYFIPCSKVGRISQGMGIWNQTVFPTSSKMLRSHSERLGQARRRYSIASRRRGAGGSDPHALFWAYMYVLTMYVLHSVKKNWPTIYLQRTFKLSNMENYIYYFLVS